MHYIFTEAMQVPSDRRNSDARDNSFTHSSNFDRTI